jgi:hypothetical protein
VDPHVIEIENRGGKAAAQVASIKVLRVWGIGRRKRHGEDEYKS